MSKTINVNVLSQKSIQNAIKEIRDYQNDFHRKLEVFVSRLADAGIEVAQNNVGGFGKYIVFSKEVDPAETECTVIIHAKETGKIISSWQTKDGIKSAEVSPLLMAEFGSGFGAENPKAGCAGSIVNLLQNDNFNHQVEIEKGVCADECATLMKDFFKRFRK